MTKTQLSKVHKHNMESTNNYIYLMCIILIASYYVGLLIFNHYDTIKIYITDIGALVIDVFIIILISNTIVRNKSKMKVFWLITLVSMISYTIGDGLWLVEELIFKYELPFPSVNDGFYLFQRLCAFISMFYLHRISVKRNSTIRTYLQFSIILVLAFILFSSMTTYEGIIDESGNLLAWIISIAYPVFDFILVFSALTLFVIKDKSNMFIIHIGLGYLLMSFTDLVYMILVNHNAYTTGSFIDPLWSISFLLIATADYTRKGEYLQNFHQKLLNALNYDAYKRAYLLIIPTIILLVLFNAYIIDDYNIMILVGYSLTSFLLIVRHDLANRQSNELKHELQSRIQLLENNKINLNENVSELKYKFEKTLEKVDRDHLTGVYNRRYIDQQKSTINDDYGDNNEYSVLIMDIDNFKGINDTYGHQIGDDILVEIASIMKLNARESEMLGRYGGDEFIMFLPGVNSEEAFIVADRIRNEIMCQIIRIEEKKIQCTISVGIANTTEKEFNSIDDIIRRADNRLYLAKKRGRNNVVKDDN